MKFRTAAVLALPFLAGACASSGHEPPLPTLPSPAHLPPVPVPVVIPDPVPDALPDLPPENPVRAAVAAQAKGVVTPRREWFKGVSYAPPYHPNNSYLVYVAEGEAVSVRFRPREVPSPVVCSDGGVILSTAWTQSGAGPTETWTLDVKARMRAGGDGRVRCRVATNFAERGYSLTLKTVPVGSRHHMQAVEWSDPYKILSTSRTVESRPVCQGSDGNYRVTGDLGAFGLSSSSISNDGAQTCIRFPPSASFDLPAAWLVEGDAERPASPQTINGSYLIDGVPPVIELRTDHATLRIERLHRKAP